MQDDQIQLGAKYRRADGTVFTITEIIGNAIDCRRERARRGVPTDLWLRKSHFANQMEGPLESP